MTAEAAGLPSAEVASKSLWVGDLQPWMDEAFLFNIFVGTQQLISVKLIRNRATGMSEGYAFLEFRAHEVADNILKTYNGQPIPGTDQVFRLNWAAYGVGKAAAMGEECASLFVGDLAPDVSDLILQEYFRQFYPSVRSAKVITDAATGRSKGYGFVRFGSENERDRALTEMAGHFLSNRPIRVSLATAKKHSVGGGATAAQAPHPSDFDPTNTTLFIGGLSSSVSEDQLRAVFSKFGDIIYVKIPAGKGCGFVQFVLRTAAERAMDTMNGQVMGTSAMRISWGRSSSRAANQAAAQQQMGGFVGGMPGGSFGGSGAFDPVAAGVGHPAFHPHAAHLAGGMGPVGPDPYVAAAFGMHGPPIFQSYQPNGAALASLIQSNGIAAPQPNGKAGSGEVAVPQQGDALAAAHVEKLGAGGGPAASSAAAATAAGGPGGKPNPALIGSQLFASFLG